MLRSAYPKNGAIDVETRNYASFRAAVFDSGKHFHQRFAKIHVEQDADLVQVSLDFITTADGTGDSGYSWKVLHLPKIGGRRKIASEFFPAHPLPVAD